MINYIMELYFTFSDKKVIIKMSNDLSMKITFLGTSHGYSEKNRFLSATLVETDRFSYLIDAGAPVEALMVNYDKSYDKIRGVFITHMHSDHVGNLTSVIEPMLGYRYNDKAVCFFPCKDGMEGFTAWMRTINASVEKLKSTVRFDVVKEGMFFDNGDIRMYAKSTMHMGEIPTYAYIMESGGRKVLFTGDMGQGFPEYSQLVSDECFDLVVCEMAHAKLSDVAEDLRKTNTKHMIINHYHMPKMEGCEEIFKTFPFPVTVAVDGYEFSV